MQIKKELNAHVASFGPPQFFITLNPNENDWSELHETYRIVHGRQDNDKTSINQEIGKDPVLWTRYFPRRIQNFMKHVLFHGKGPLGRVLHWFWRIEYQYRGTEHVHLVVWTEDRCDQMDSPEQYLDKYLTARQPSQVETEL